MIEMLVSIKFKYRKILLSSIATLFLSIGLKVLALGLMMNQNIPIPLCFYFHVGVIVANCVVPWSFLLLWNKLD